MIGAASHGGRLVAAAILAASVAFSTAVVFAARTSIFVPDRGKFKIMVNGVQAGEESFEISRDGDNWVDHGSTEVRTPSGVEHVTGKLELRSDGTPVRYQWSTDGANKAAANITFSGSKVTIDLHVQGKRPYSQQFTFASPNIAVLDNNLYDQFAVLARLYDWEKKGEQTFPVLIPQELTPGTVTLNSLGEQPAGGRQLEELQVKTADLEVDLFLDGRKLVRIVSPSANAEIDRE